MKATGFTLRVYRNSGSDCSARGLSSIHEIIFVLTDGVFFKERGPTTEDDAERLGIPVFEVSKAGGRYHVRPKGERRWTMFGGNFAYSGDSRTPQFPIHIHDRIEG